MSRPPPSPKRIGPYRVIRPIASGGMAAVYEVEDDETGQRLALKLLTQRGLARPRFHREYRALTRLDHPHIVRVYRFGLDDDGRPYLTMELLDGEPAQVYAKSLGRPGTPRRTAEVIRIARDVSSALAYLHDRGIVHRDLKSSNVMVLADGTVRLLDFGTARLLRTQDEITRHGEFVGTFAYAPPEQLTGGTVDARADIYSLGVLLYRLLTGKRPFEGDNPHELARLHLEHVPPPPVELAAGVPRVVSDMVCQMLHKQPEGRPNSAWSVQEVLDQELADGASDADGPREAPPELIGREASVDAVVELLDQRRPGSAMLVNGASGSGRERLLAHATIEARRRGWLVLTTAFDGGFGPGALAVIGRRAGRGLGLAPDAALPLEVLGRVGGAVGDHPGPPALGAALARLIQLRVRFDGQPVVMVLRRVDRADQQALDALVALRERLVAENLAAVFLGSAATATAGESASLDSAFAGARRVELGPVTPHEMDRLTTAVLGRRPPPPGLSRRLRRATGGMPGHAVEVLHAMIHEGLLVPSRSADSRHTWQDRSGGRVAVPARVGRNLLLRVDALHPAARRLLEALAVAGVPVPSWALGIAADLADEALQQGVAELEASGLVVRSDESLRPELGLTEQLVREGMREGRRRVLYGRLAHALIQSAPSDGKVRLMLEAGLLEQAAVDAVAWSEQRLNAHEAASALPLLSRVVGKVAGDEEVPNALRARLLLLHGRASSEVAPGDARGARSLDQAAELADEPLLVEVDLERAALARRAGDLARAHELQQRTRQRLERHANPEVLHRLWEEEAAGRAAAGDSRGALKAWRRARQGALDRGDSAAAARDRVGIAQALTAEGHIRAAQEAAEQAWLDLRAMGDETGAWLAAAQLASILRMQGRLSEALQLVEPLIDLARSWGGPTLQAVLQIELANCRIALLRLGEVRDLLAEVDALSVTRTLPELRARAGAARGRLALASDDPEGAVRALQPAVGAAEAGGFVALSHEIRAVLGEALVAAGAREDGLRAARAAVAGLRRLRCLPSLALATSCQQRALGVRADPAASWADLELWLSREPVRVLRMDRLLDELAWAVAAGDSSRSLAAVSAANTLLAEIEALLNPTDRAALRVHPWRTRIERAAAC